MDKEELSKLKDAKQISEMFPIWSASTYRVYAAQGRVPCVRIGHKRKKALFNPDEIREFFDKQKIVEKGG